MISATNIHHCPRVFHMQERLLVKGFVTLLVSAFLFWYPAECLPIPKRLEHRSEEDSNVHTSSTSPYSVSCVDVVLSNRAPLSVCREQPFVTASACVDFHDPPTPASNSTEYNPVLPLQALPGCKRWPVETLYPPLLGVFNRITF